MSKQLLAHLIWMIREWLKGQGINVLMLAFLLSPSLLQKIIERRRRVEDSTMPPRRAIERDG